MARLEELQAKDRRLVEERAEMEREPPLGSPTVDVLKLLQQVHTRIGVGARVGVQLSGDSVHLELYARSQDHQLAREYSVVELRHVSEVALHFSREFGEFSAY